MERNYFSEEEIRLIKQLSREGATFDELFEALPYRKETSLRNFARRHHLSFMPKCDVCCDKHTLVKWIKSGLTESQMAKLLDVSVGRIKYAKRVYGLIKSDEKRCKPIVSGKKSPEMVEYERLSMQEAELEKEIQEAIKNGDSISDLLSKVYVVRRKIYAQQQTNKYDKNPNQKISEKFTI